ncbi:MAG: zf-TFIIB domain-containing protein [Phycisphaeraceae bacterium]
MKCPKCGGNMHAVPVGDFEVDRCGSCEGIWFDLREIDHARQIKDSDAMVDPGQPGGSAGTTAKETDAIRDITCPRCGTNVKLVKLAFPDQPHIHYEQCATCGGAFLDAGEFQDLMHLTFAERVRKLLRPLRH